MNAYVKRHLSNIEALPFYAEQHLIRDDSIEGKRDTLKSLAVQTLFEVKRLTEEFGGDPKLWDVVMEAAQEAANEAFFASIEERDEAAEARRDPVERQLSRADFLYEEARS